MASSNGDILPADNLCELSFVVQPPSTVTKNRVLYPPIIIKAFVPNVMCDDEIMAVPCACDGNGIYQDGLEIVQGDIGLDGSFNADIQDTKPEHFNHKGWIVKDETSPDITSSLNRPGSPPEGYYAVYFVLHRLAFNTTGDSLRIRINVINTEHAMEFVHLGMVDTTAFKVGSSSIERKVPSKSALLLLVVNIFGILLE